jgi:REP element-mobilizing transposase RayT
MSQSLAQLYVHLIFSTKHREPWLRPEDREHLHSYLGGILRQAECPLLGVGSVGDHVHLVFRQSKNLSLAQIVEDVKTTSSKWLKTQGLTYQNFHWQAGYGAFSVSASRLAVVLEYVQHQEEHHKAETFQDELRRFFKKAGLEFDERYAWD